ncbi:unnamed protein product [Clavelina lepadiformis]|uniref:Uncharacterized protein n=1 Tax=Clavelina lepadiformis TaxID=159417 RepID=A0ABP0FJ91_CLALP
MNLCYALAKTINPDDIRPFFRDLTILPNPEVEIQNLPPHESPREQFIRLFNVLVCHGMEHFTPQKVVNVCYENGWMTYSEVVIFHFPNVQLAPMTSCSGGEGLSG